MYRGVTTILSFGVFKSHLIWSLPCFLPFWYEQLQFSFAMKVLLIDNCWLFVYPTFVGPGFTPMFSTTWKLFLQVLKIWSYSIKTICNYRKSDQLKKTYTTCILNLIKSPQHLHRFFNWQKKGCQTTNVLQQINNTEILKNLELLLRLFVYSRGSQHVVHVLLVVCEGLPCKELPFFHKNQDSQVFSLHIRLCF